MVPMDFTVALIFLEVRGDNCEVLQHLCAEVPSFHIVNQTQYFEHVHLGQMTAQAINWVWVQGVVGSRRFVIFYI